MQVRAFERYIPFNKNSLSLSIVYLFKMGISLKGKNLLKEGANSFL